MADHPGAGRFLNAAASRRVAHGNLMYLFSRRRRHFRDKPYGQVEVGDDTSGGIELRDLLVQKLATYGVSTT